MKSPTDKTAATAEYVLGHSDRELQRLSTQAGLIAPITRQFFIDAGIGRAEAGEPGQILGGGTSLQPTV